MSQFESDPGVEIDATVAGHIAGDVIDAVASHDPSALDEMVKALNQDLKRHDLRIVPTSEVDPRTYTQEDILQAERIAHLLDMGDVLDLRLNPSLGEQYKMAEALIHAEDLLPARRPHDQFYVAPYDGSKDSFNDIRQTDRAYYQHLQKVIRAKKGRR